MERTCACPAPAGSRVLSSASSRNSHLAPRPPWSARVSRAEFCVLAELPSHARVRPLTPTPLRMGTMRPTLPLHPLPPRPGGAKEN
ncbi:hypothetical protein HNQ64_004910 [Prosthecobacter dejongeii]|uniref:Uncharacterized protein n=1 Tax=Prosthecobacter dejongeii TaxID=48465 RepID=A0A7W7YQR6_9BACT|nr:hypothetical protein [Prosthecobacter dejongeii]